mgnify:CR=1 FL=1
MINVRSHPDHNAPIAKITAEVKMTFLRPMRSVNLPQHSAPRIAPSKPEEVTTSTILSSMPKSFWKKESPRKSRRYQNQTIVLPWRRQSLSHKSSNIYSSCFSCFSCVFNPSINSKLEITPDLRFQRRIRHI